MRTELIVQLEGDDPTPELGYPFAKKLLARNRPFTALFAYNDISAIGSIRAFQEAGLRVPEDISVVGFDDIRLPCRTTQVLQPCGNRSRRWERLRRALYSIESRSRRLCAGDRDGARTCGAQFHRQGTGSTFSCES